jgi:hypothetical protein
MLSFQKKEVLFFGRQHEHKARAPAGCVVQKMKGLRGLRTAGAGDLPLSEFRFYALINQRTDDGDNIGEHLAVSNQARWRRPKYDGVARVDTSFILGIAYSTVMTDVAGFRAIGRESVHRDF